MGLMRLMRPMGPMRQMGLMGIVDSIDFRLNAGQTRNPPRSILGVLPQENVRKNCIKRDFTRHKKRAIAQHTKAYVSKWLSIVTQ